MVPASTCSGQRGRGRHRDVAAQFATPDAEPKGVTGAAPALSDADHMEAGIEGVAELVGRLLPGSRALAAIDAPNGSGKTTPQDGQAGLRWVLRRRRCSP